MLASLSLLFCLLPALCAAQVTIAPTTCRTHEECQRRLQGPASLHMSRAMSELGLYVSVTDFKCKITNDCGHGWGCRAGRCVPGGIGASCRTDSVNCLPGLSCDAATAKCVREVAGAVCRRSDDCGFGHSCFFKNKAEGVCKLGLPGTTACRIDINCVGPLQCFQGGVYDRAFHCGRPVDLPSAPRPRTFGTCETDYGCTKDVSIGQRLVCFRGTCRPPYLGLSCENQLGCGLYSYCHKGLFAPAVAGSPCLSANAEALNPGCEPDTMCNTPRGTGLNMSGTCVVGEEGMSCRDGRECKEGLLCGSS